ncbi:hypothetical protein PG993_004203 [Apiospora rasikravindrae]|uniref:DUF6594 domain-containing protein n=1 Tax=Apiospora rasikravindrae TaxID=990691 RepID=A0ABR1TEH5_9PEZI
MGSIQDSRVKDIESNKINQEDLDERPCKYIGYKEFARYLSLTDEYFVLRRYDLLHCRILVTLQQRIAILEERLDELDEKLSRQTPDVHNGTVRNDQPERQLLVEEIARELKSYGNYALNMTIFQPTLLILNAADMVLSYKELKSAPSAPKRNINNINTWLSNNYSPIEDAEVAFLKAKDLITVARPRKSVLRQFFEEHILIPTRGLFGLLGQRDGPDGTNVYGSDEPVDAIASVSIFVVGMGMLIAPLWILAVTHDMFRRLGVITAFIAVLLGVLTSATLAKPFEILAATAGYSAVLVVFLQIGTDGGV